MVREIAYKLLTPEGYVDEDGNYYYYRRDHLGNVREVWKATDSVALTVQRTRYYPSGLPWEYLAGDSASLQPYKYGGKEFLETHGLDMYDNHARWYYATIMRTITPDPMAEVYYGISPYAWCGNNPIRNVDHTGMEFTDNAWEQVNRLIAYIDKQQAKNTESIEAKQSKIDAGGLSDRKVARLQRQIDGLKENSSDLEVVRGEIATLAASDQIYDIKSDHSMNINGTLPGTGEYRSGAVFNFDNGNFELLMGDGSLASLAHELKHAYQFETGAFSTSNYGDGQPFYDQADEWEAYSRGALFGGEHIYTLPSIYSNYQKGPVDATNHPNIMHILNNPAILQRIVDRPGVRMAFRINGVTYRTK